MIEPFEYFTATTLVYGGGRAQTVGDDLRLRWRGVSKALLVSDPGVIEAGLVDPVLNSLKSAGIKARLFGEVKSDPTSVSVDLAAEAARQAAADCVIGVGGGSALDVAKLVAVVAAEPSPIEDYVLMKNPLPRKNLPAVMIPTTSGTGAEVTRTAIVTNGRGRKAWIWGEAIAPELAVLDPLMTAGLPAQLTAATALDALVHAIEACTHNAGNPVIRGLGLQAIRLIAGNFKRAMDQPDDLIARGHLAVAATLAGMAINSAGCCVAHAMGHALGTLAGIHHGRAVALVLNAVYPWNAEAAVEVHAEIARALGVTEMGEGDEKLAMAGVDAYNRLLRDSGLDLSLSGDGLGEVDVPRLVAATMAPENIGMCEAACRVPDRTDLERIARQVLTVG